jgi:hypothetical protein
MIGTTRQNPKILAPHWLLFFFKRSKVHHRTHPRVNRKSQIQVGLLSPEIAQNFHSQAAPAA